MRSDIFAYLSGPMTARNGFSIEENVAAGVRAHLQLLAAGIPNFCPHLSGAFPTAWSAISWEQWIAYDLRVIDRCTHVVTLPRWETSAGANAEVVYAVDRGIPVLTLNQMLVAHGKATA